MLKKILGIFRPQPRKCSSCLDLSPGVHQVWSGQRAGHLTEKLCTKCLTARLATAIRGKTIVFVEPLTSDSYCYTPATGTATLSLSRMQLALSALPPCAMAMEGNSAFYADSYRRFCPLLLIVQLGAIASHMTHCLQD
jgi:hypothetical protein